MFERFTRLDDGRARDAGGLGLGLSMVKSITEHHGGTVVIEDAPIGGARLRVNLPAVLPLQLVVAYMAAFVLVERIVSPVDLRFMVDLARSRLPSRAAA